jgi:hypothetical protein
MNICAFPGSKGVERYVPITIKEVVMHLKHWLQASASLLLVPAFVWVAYAAEPAARQAGGGRGIAAFQARLDKAVGLTAEQQETVRGLLAQQGQDMRSLREGVDAKMAAIRDQTDGKIRALLNAEQQKKFDAFSLKQKQARKAKRSKPS